MKKHLRTVWERLQVPRFLPHLIASRLSSASALIESDVRRWHEVRERPLHSFAAGLVHLLVWFPEFRSLFYFRLGPLGRVLAPLARPMPTLYINMARRDVGPGLFIQHGFATILSARSIGAGCWINQQVTVGYKNKTDAPTLCDGAVVNAGAIVIGAVTVGAGAVVGANSVVTRDIPAGAVAVGSPARVLEQSAGEASDGHEPW